MTQERLLKYNTTIKSLDTREIMQNPNSLKNLKKYQPKWNKGKTRTIRVPIALADELLEIAHRLDAGEQVNAHGQEVMIEDLVKKAREILLDEEVVRKRDRSIGKKLLSKLFKKDLTYWK